MVWILYGIKCMTIRINPLWNEYLHGVGRAYSVVNDYYKGINGYNVKGKQ